MTPLLLFIQSFFLILYLKAKKESKNNRINTKKDEPNKCFVQFSRPLQILIVLVVGVVLVGFVDENSFMRRMQLDMQIADMEQEIAKYKAINEADTKQLRDLRRNPRSVAKIARERYFMKADDEDIFVLSDDEKPKTTNDETVN